MTLHQRIAEHLGWDLKDVQSFSFQALRDFVTDAEIKAEITKAINTGDYLWR